MDPQNTDNRFQMSDSQNQDTVGNQPQVNQTALSPKEKKSYTTIITASLFAISILVVALIFFNLGKGSVKIPEKQETVEFTTENLATTPSPTSTQDEATKSSVPQKTTTKILLADGELDGYVASDGTLNSTLKIQPGRNVDTVSRGFVSFDTNSIPTGIIIKTAQLRLYQENTIGTPYTVLGDVRVDHLTYGDSLDADDYSRPALLGNIGTLSISKRIGWNEVDVTDAVKDDFANARKVSQFRIHFAKETTGGDTKGDYAVYTSSDKKATNQPELVIEYY